MNDEPKIVPMRWSHLRETNFPKRKMLLAPWLPERSLTMIYASPGIGKTWLAMSIAGAVAGGGELFGWKADQPAHVVYIDGEMPTSELKARGKQLFKGDPFLEFIASDAIDGGLPDLARPEVQTEITHRMSTNDGPPKLVVLDNLSSLIHSGNENEAESWAVIQSWLLSLKRQGTSVLLVHHANKAGGARGTSKRADLLDAIIHLSRPKGSHAGDGCRFELSFEKSRSLLGKDAQPFEAALQQDEDGNLAWAKIATGHALKREVLRLADEGLSIRDIATELNVKKSRVHVIVQKAKKDGQLKTSAECPPVKLRTV